MMALQTERRIGTSLAMALSLLLAPSAIADIRELPVPSATIYPDTVITDAQITGRSFRVTPTSTTGFATGKDEIIGKQARRRLIAGKPVPLSALTQPLRVRRGSIVDATYSEDGFSIAASLVALEDGAAGDTIALRNTSTGIVLRAVVKPDGTLAVAAQ